MLDLRLNCECCDREGARRRRAGGAVTRYAAAAIAASLVLTAVSAWTTAATYTCRFGESAVVAHREGHWQRGIKPGTVAITFQRVGKAGTATRHLDGDTGLPAMAVDSTQATHFILLAGPSPGGFIETTTIHDGDAKRVAVRSVHSLTGLRSGIDVSMDYGHCEVAP